MSKLRYEGPDEFKPISAWGYIGYSLLFAIPFLGWIMLFVFALSNQNINRRNYARSFFCLLLIVILVTLAFSVLAFFNISDIPESIKHTFPQLQEFIEEIQKLGAKRNRQSSTTLSRNTTSQRTSALPSSTNSSSSSNTKSSSKSTSSSSSSSGVRKNVKEAIDSYETFFNEYVAFMKKYSSSTNPLSMLSDYTNMMTKYATTLEKWEKFDKENNLNDAELLYYSQACIRIEKLLLSVY